MGRAEVTLTVQLTGSACDCACYVYLNYIGHIAVSAKGAHTSGKEAPVTPLLIPLASAGINGAAGNYFTDIRAIRSMRSLKSFPLIKEGQVKSSYRLNFPQLCASDMILNFPHRTVPRRFRSLGRMPLLERTLILYECGVAAQPETD